MEEYVSVRDSLKFMDSLFDEEESVKDLYSPRSYSGIKKALINVGLSLVNSTVPSKIRCDAYEPIGTFNSNIVTTIRIAINNTKKEDQEYKDLTGVARNIDGIRFINMDVELNGKQRTNKFAKIVFDENRPSRLTNISMFFAELRSKLERKKQLQRIEKITKENPAVEEPEKFVVERVQCNIMNNYIYTLTEDMLQMFTDSIKKNFTVLGVELIKSEDGPIKEDSATIELKSKELAELKKLRDDIETMSSGEEEKIPTPSFKQMWTQSAQTGFVGVGSLLVFISILFTIVELVVLYIDSLN